MMIVITALVQVASEVVCDISAFHSAMPKRKRGNDNSSGGQHSAGKQVILTRNSKAESSGGQHSVANEGSHSADDLSVLFLDENNFAFEFLKLDLKHCTKSTFWIKVSLQQLSLP